MSERDDEVLRRYRAINREAPPPALDAAILAASRRPLRARGVPRWAAPLSVAAVLVLALGLVLKVQREAPESAMPVESRAAPEPREAIAPAPPTTRQASPTTQQASPATQEASPTPQPAAPLARRAQQPKVETKLAAPASPEAARSEAAAAPSAPAAAAPAAAAPAAAAPAAKRSDGVAASDAISQANVGAAKLSAQRSLAIDPLQRELERIARLREEGRDDEADAALAAFQREHADFRIEPAMWERVRRR